MNTVDFPEKDGISGLAKWGAWNIALGLIFTLIGLIAGFSQLNSYYGFPIPFFVLAAIGILMINSGSLFIVLALLGEGIAFRIGRHLSIQPTKTNSGSNESKLQSSQTSVVRTVAKEAPVITSESKAKCKVCKKISPLIQQNGLELQYCSHCGANAKYLVLETK